MITAPRFPATWGVIPQPATQRRRSGAHAEVGQSVGSWALPILPPPNRVSWEAASSTLFVVVGGTGFEPATPRVRSAIYTKTRWLATYPGMSTGAPPTVSTLVIGTSSCRFVS